MFDIFIPGLGAKLLILLRPRLDFRKNVGTEIFQIFL
jgi:hypothetical protein